MTKTESMLATALKDIIEECPNPKTPYGLKVVETAKKALFVSGLDSVEDEFDAAAMRRWSDQNA